MNTIARIRKFTMLFAAVGLIVAATSEPASAGKHRGRYVVVTGPSYVVAAPAPVQTVYAEPVVVASPVQTVYAEPVVVATPVVRAYQAPVVVDRLPRRVVYPRRVVRFR